MLQIGYYADFKNQDTLLLAGSREDIEFLRSFFVEWTGGELDLIEYLRTRAETHTFSVSTIHVRREAIRDSFVWDRGTGTWSISEANQAHITCLLDGLLMARTGGHHYLEPVEAQVQIMVSMDEGYPLPSGCDRPTGARASELYSKMDGANSDSSQST